MPSSTMEMPFQEGLRALVAGKTGNALEWFEKAVDEENTPVAISYLAYCRAKQDGGFREAVALCMDAMKEEPRNSEIYLNLGRIHLLAGQKRSAIRAFELGLRYGGTPHIEHELKCLGRRKAPPLPFLARGNPINRLLGKIMKKLGMR